MEKIVRHLARYEGRVQGVGFRMTAVAQSDGLTVHGFVRNEPDGSVTMDVEGPAADLKELMRRVDSAMSGMIEHCHLENLPPRGISSGFTIRY